MAGRDVVCDFVVVTLNLLLYVTCYTCVTPDVNEESQRIDSNYARY